MSDTPSFYLSMDYWPAYVQKYARYRCWQRQREAQGGIVGGKWKDGGDDEVLEWMERGRNGHRPMARAHEIWPQFCEDAKRWYELERAKVQRKEER